MTVTEKQQIRRLLIAGWKLIKAEGLTEAIEHIDEIIEAAEDFDVQQPVKKG